jgi:hypothetical protein
MNFAIGMRSTKRLTRMAARHNDTAFKGVSEPQLGQLQADFAI